MKHSKKGLSKSEAVRAGIELKKTAFIKALKTNGGTVTNALKTACFRRQTAYEEFKTDKKFADLWLEAIDVANDELFTEARRRAKTGVLEPVYHNGIEVGKVRKYSDTLLIFLLKQGDAKQKWRNRLIKAGNLAVETVREEGKKAGLSETQIVQIQNKMVDELNNISLI